MEYLDPRVSHVLLEDKNEREEKFAFVIKMIAGKTAIVNKFKIVDPIRWERFKKANGISL